MNAPLKNETELKGLILKALKSLYPDSRFWTVNAGGRSRRAVQAPTGTPDILGYLAPKGTLVGIECKMPGKKSSEAQIEWHVHATSAGCWITVAYSVSDALSFIKLAREETSK